MKKGFIHIVEIVIISLVVFVLVIQIATIPRAEAEWDRTKLILQGNDILHTLNAKGVNWLSRTDVVGNLTEVLAGTNLRYRILVRNAIPANITIGCLACTPGELEELESALAGSFTLNGERIRFNVHPAALDSIPPWGLDVACLGRAALPGLEMQVEDFLAGGGGVLEIRDLEAADTAERADIFGLETWETAPGTGNIEFNPGLGPDSRHWSIWKYFRHIPSGLDFSLWSSFDGFLEPTEDRVILRELASGAPALVVNEYYGGRAAWLSDGDNTLEDRKALIRALAAWAAGDTYEVVPADIREPQAFSLHTVINQDMFQPIEIVLSLGYIF
ncbi:MAG: hypothetical protein ACE5FW_00175 [Candidatus Aenigmatarchaeota archaeon]